MNNKIIKPSDQIDFVNEQIKSTLCNTIVKESFNALKHKDDTINTIRTKGLQGFLNYIDSVVSKEHRADEIWYYCTPYKLIHLLLENGHRLHLYGGGADNLAIETKIIIELGFAYVEDQYICLNKTFIRLINAIELKDKIKKDEAKLINLIDSIKS